MHELIRKEKPKFNQAKPPNSKYRLKIYNFIKHQAFDPFILSLIMINILTMALEYEEAKQDYLNVLSQINLCLTLVFIGECVLKLIAFGVHVFFLDPWN